jgi:hypothetical protein
MSCLGPLATECPLAPAHIASAAIKLDKYCSNIFEQFLQRKTNEFEQLKAEIESLQQEATLQSAQNP